MMCIAVHTSTAIVTSNGLTYCSFYITIANVDDKQCQGSSSVDKP